MAKRSSKNKDLIREALLLGFGLMDVTQKKAEKVLKDMKKDKNITKSGSRKAAKSFLKSLDKSKKEIAKIIRKHLKRAIKDLDIATKEDIRKLRRR